MKCSLCEAEIEVQPNGWAEGHNAWPIKEDRCCSACNITKVLPERTKLFRMEAKPTYIGDINELNESEGG